MPRDLLAGVPGATKPVTGPRDLLADNGSSRAYTDALSAGSKASQVFDKPERWSGQPAIVPIEFRQDEPGVRLAMPSLVEDIITTIMGPGEALRGNMSDVEFDPMTGEVMPFSTDMIETAATSAMNVLPGAPSATSFVKNRPVLPDGRGVPKIVRRALEADGVPLDEVGPRVSRLGADGMVADLGPNVRNQTAAIASTPGPGQTTVVNALTPRKLAAPDRVTAEIDDILGIAPVPSYVQTEIKANMKNVGPEYDQLLATAPPADEAAVSALASSLDQIAATEKGAAGTAASTVRGLLNVPGTNTLDTSAAGILSARRAVGDMLDANPGGYESEILVTTKRQLTDLLETVAPGIRQIDAKYAELGEQSRAVDKGQTALGNERSDLRPQELADYVEERAIPQGDDVYGPSGVPFRLSQGTRAELDRLLGTKANDRVALNQMLKGESDWNHDRLVTIFGQEKTDQLYALLDNERAMAETENLALSGSKTSAMQSAKSDIGTGPARPGFFKSAANLNFGDAADTVLNRMFGSFRSGRNNQAAAALTSHGDWRPGETLRSQAPVTLAPAAAGAQDIIDLIFQGRPVQTAPSVSDEEIIARIMT